MASPADGPDAARRPAADAGLAGWLQRQWWQPRPTTAAQLLRPLSWLYRALAALERQRHPPGVADVPVVVVGNLIAGGAGKTPSVIALVRWLREAGWTPGVISRGYGRQSADDITEVRPDQPASRTGDEPLLIRLRTGAPVWVGRDRLAVLQALRRAHPEVNLVVSDDGLQHHRLPRDVQVVVFDERGAGNGLLLPAGPLREPLPAALPPRTVVLYNAPAPSTPLPGHVAERGLAGITPLADWWAGAPATQPLRSLQDRPLLAAAGIASPERFFGMLAAAGLVFNRLPLPDHDKLNPLPWPATTPDVLVTEKDAVKLRPERLPPGQRVWVATLDFRLPPGFAAALQHLLPQPPTAP